MKKDNQVVECESLEQFADLVYMFTVKGLTFEATAGDLTIVLTGGF